MPPVDSSRQAGKGEKKRGVGGLPSKHCRLQIILQTLPSPGSWHQIFNDTLEKGERSPLLWDKNEGFLHCDKSSLKTQMAKCTLGF